MIWAGKFAPGPFLFAKGFLLVACLVFTLHRKRNLGIMNYKLVWKRGDWPGPVFLFKGRLHAVRRDE
jgi:hypothetical protein